MPAFNYKGEETIKTTLGAAISMLIFVVVLAYSMLKMTLLLERSDPIIAKYTQDAFFSVDDPLDFRSMNNKIAFAFQSYMSKEFKDDPRYVKWFVRLYGRRNGEPFE